MGSVLGLGVYTSGSDSISSILYTKWDTGEYVFENMLLSLSLSLSAVGLDDDCQEVCVSVSRSSFKFICESRLRSHLGLAPGMFL